MEMTELQECLEVTALTVPQPLGNVCRPTLPTPPPARSEEVSPSICVREVDATPGPGLPQEHAMYVFKNRYLFSRRHTLTY